MPPVVRRGEPVCPGREAGRRASAAGPGMAHRRMPWDKRGNRGHPTQEGEQVGEKTFGDFGSFQSHSPSRAAAAKPRRGRSPRVLHGEAMPISCRCNALRLLAPYLSPARGEGIVAADDYAPLIDPTGLLHPAPHPVVGEAYSRYLVPHPSGC